MSKCRILISNQLGTQTAPPWQTGHVALYCKQKIKQVNDILILTEIYLGTINMAVNYKLILKCSVYFTFIPLHILIYQDHHQVVFMNYIVTEVLILNILISEFTEFFWTFSIVLYSKKHDVSETGSVSVLR
jgi:hypothetical protein